MRYRFIVLAIAIGVVTWIAISVARSGKPYHPPAQTFEGSTSELHETIVVPTLDTPIPSGKSAIWCASFELAWTRAKNDVLKCPIQIQGAQSICDRLNASSSSEKDLDAPSFCALAGFLKDGISDKIAAELHSKFPQLTPPKFDGPGNTIVAYSYLSLNIPFQIPYFDNTEAVEFVDAAGKKTAVKSFGIRSQDDYAYRQLRRQAHVLFSTSVKNDYETLDEFAVDLCNDSRPFQIVLAVVHPQATLGEALDRIDQQATASEKDQYFHEIGCNDVLLVPSHHWDFTHHFKELESGVLSKGFEGYCVTDAIEMIRFKLDRSGAELSAESKLLMKPTPKLFIFNRPHLIYIKKRGCERPIFAMWVANAELLDKW